MHSFAQTNIQLLNQLRRDGYPADDLIPVVRSYELTIRLFTGRFRASGKTFIAHLVGTASILGSLHVSPRLVAAGLLHAAYLIGDFGDGSKGCSNAKRDQLRSVAGDEVEEYVARYTALRWGSDAIPALYDSLQTLGPLDRDVLLLRLANELEEYLDLGVLYCGDEKRRQTNYLNHSGRLMIQIAEQLGFPALGVGLARAFEEAAGADIPPSLRGSNPPNHAFLLAPPSYQRLMEAVASRLKGAGSPVSQENGEPSGSPR